MSEKQDATQNKVPEQKDLKKDQQNSAKQDDLSLEELSKVSGGRGRGKGLGRG